MVADGVSWYVLIEEGGLDSDMRKTRVEHVDGDLDRAREMALEIAKSHLADGRYGELERAVFRVGENSFVVALGGGWRKESFRVSVGELVHLKEG